MIGSLDDETKIAMEENMNNWKEKRVGPDAPLTQADTADKPSQTIRMTWKPSLTFKAKELQVMVSPVSWARVPSPANTAQGGLHFMSEGYMRCHDCFAVLNGFAKLEPLVLRCTLVYR